MRARRSGPLRSQWLAASELAEQQRICREIQAVAFEEIPYIPIGLYKQPTAYRKSHHRHSRRHRRLLERTPRMSTIAIFGSYVLSRKDGAQDVLRDHWVLLEGKTDRRGHARHAHAPTRSTIAPAASSCRAC